MTTDWLASGAEKRAGTVKRMAGNGSMVELVLPPPLFDGACGESNRPEWTISILLLAASFVGNSIKKKLEYHDVPFGAVLHDVRTTSYSTYYYSYRTYNTSTVTQEIVTD